jgi:hypothetical protein
MEMLNNFRHFVFRNVLALALTLITRRLTARFISKQASTSKSTITSGTH